MTSLTPFDPIGGDDALVPSNKMLRAGDIIIEDITIESYTGFILNLRGQFISMTIYEDLYSNSLSGRLLLTDTLALMRHVPIVGNETVTIKFYTPGDMSGDKPKTVTFNAFNAMSVSSTTDNSKILSLELVSSEFVEGTTTRFCQSYTKMKYSEMARSIFKDRISPEGSIDIKDTMGYKNIVVPYWTPFYAMNWLCKKSISADDINHCDYMFYQTLDGLYHFMPLSELKRREVKAKFERYPGGGRTETGEINMEVSLRKIKNMVIVQLPDTAKEAANGVYGSTLHTLDLVGKEYKQTFYRYAKEFDKEVGVSKYPIVSLPNHKSESHITNHIMMYPKHTEQYDGYYNNDNVETYASRRNSLMGRMKHQILRLTVPGDSRLRVGDIVEVEVPSFEETLNKDEYRDIILSGNYMITSIMHKVNEGYYEMDIVVSKDSLDFQLPDSKEQTLRSV